MGVHFLAASGPIGCVVGTVVLAMLAACERAPMPWQRDGWQGEVTVHGPDLDVAGRVTFVRPQTADIGTLQLDVMREGRLDNATLLASGKTTAFTDGQPRAISAGEQRALAVLAALFAWPLAEATRQARADTVSVRLPDGSEYVCSLLPTPQDVPHHGRR